MVGAVVAVFLLAILYEGLKTLREYLVFMDWRHSRQNTSTGKAVSPRINSSDSDDEEEEGEKRCTDQSFILARNGRRQSAPRRRKG